jgi:two-component sensor histidine kinase
VRFNQQRTEREAQARAERKMNSELKTQVKERTSVLQKTVDELNIARSDLETSLAEKSGLLEEKNVLLKEVHHRSKNNMQIISGLLTIQSEVLENETFANALEETRRRIGSMASLHENLYRNDDLKDVNVRGYIESIVIPIRDLSRAKHPVAVTIDVEDTKLDIDVASPLGLIVNELVSNCYKHAFSDLEDRTDLSITVSFKGDDDFYTLTVEDNGKGLPIGYDPNDQIGISMGAEIITLLTNQLDADLAYHSNKGTVFSLKIPKPPARSISQ